MDEVTQTQNQCHEEFIILCKEFMTKADAIDKNTPWSNVAPQWWLNMNDMQRIAFNEIEKANKLSS